MNDLDRLEKYRSYLRFLLENKGKREAIGAKRHDIYQAIAHINRLVKLIHDNDLEGIELLYGKINDGVIAAIANTYIVNNAREDINDMSVTEYDLVEIKGNYIYLSDKIVLKFETDEEAEAFLIKLIQEELKNA